MSLSDYIKEQEDEVVATAEAELDQKIADLFTAAIDEPVTDEKIEEFAEENGTTSEEVKAKAFALLTNLLVNGSVEEEPTDDEDQVDDEEVEESTKITKEDADASRVNGFRLYTLKPEFTEWIQSDEVTDAVDRGVIVDYLDENLPADYEYNTSDDLAGILGRHGVDFVHSDKRTQDEYSEYYDNAVVAQGHGVDIIDIVLLKDYIDDGSLNTRNESFKSVFELISEGLKSTKI